MPLTALMIPLILGMAGVGVDASMWMMERRSLQNAADAAVIAAAWEIANNHGGEAIYSATKEARANGYRPESDGTLDISIDQNESGRTVVTASISQKASLYFSRVVFSGEVYTAAAAASAVILPTGSFCMLSLNEEDDGGIVVAGNATLESSSCGMAANSSSDAALDLRGNVTLEVGDVHLAGDYQISGNGVTFDYASLKTNAGHVRDPYRDLDVPEYGGCDHTNKSVSGGGTHILQPGVYCGGISTNGNNDVILEDGVYIIDGGNFNIGGNGTIIGENVTIILTSSSGSNYGIMNLTGGKDVYIGAPGPGNPTAGVAIYADRNGPPASHKLNGNGLVELNGVFYAPNDHIGFGGTRETVNPRSSCTHIISSTIAIHGNPSIENECDGVGVRDMGNISVRLIM